MKVFLSILLLSVTTTCGAMRPPVSTPTPAVGGGLPDYTVLTVRGETDADGTRREFAQIAFRGSTREILLSFECYERIRDERLKSIPNTLQVQVPPECRP